MIFSSRLSKFGKGDNISLYMETSEKINIYYFKDGVLKKELTFSDSGLSLKSTDDSFPYNEVVQLGKYLVTRIDKSLGIISNEQ